MRATRAIDTVLENVFVPDRYNRPGGSPGGAGSISSYSPSSLGAHGLRKYYYGLAKSALDKASPP